MTQSEVAGLYTAHKDRLVAQVTARIRCSETAEDFVDEGFLGLLQRVETGCDLEHPLAYWVKSIYNLIRRTHARKVTGARALEQMRSEQVPLRSSPEDELHESELDALAGMELAGLPTGCQCVMSLAQSGLSDDEIAVTLGITKRGVQKQKQVSRAKLKALRTFLSPPLPNKNHGTVE